ncbi:LytR/AlgR family response regulator transcription factor [Natronospira bacteriovora]|uniref:LytTR family DNA-binding domain-containing protein n=1 Tax=Natronospira bacteriovora TaxID=3069753 RepID=A0ABU0W756_9GAMM|nr:LytTR family DNA-binding domain-containing protein [Natronospira sp. AB-CW4]MDQ2069841.1 LytTR family DNA-binding domain-containing protein [Natronospira sp. AB-CW4]
MKVLIVDDEALARGRLRHLIEGMDGWDVVGEAGNGAEALDVFSRSGADVVLLDIRMPGMDGLSAARKLAELDQPPAVIFTTAYDRFAMEAFEAQGVDYLLKPIRAERLHQALERAKRPSRAQLADLRLKSGEPEEEQGRQHIRARMGDQLHLIPIEDVFFFRAEHKYVVVRHREGEVLVEEPLKQLEEEFARRFQRIHRNALVAIDQVSRLEKVGRGRFRLYLRDCDESLEVSRRMLPAVRERLGL